MAKRKSQAVSDKFKTVLETFREEVPWANEFLDSFNGAGYSFEALACVVTARAYLRETWGDGAERDKKISALSAAEARSRLRSMIEYAENLADDASVISQVLALRRRTASSQAGRRANAAKKIHDKDGKVAVMNKIRDKWIERKGSGMRFSATAFAHEMHKKFRGVVTVEAIKNAQTRWTREYHPARAVTLISHDDGTN